MPTWRLSLSAVVVFVIRPEELVRLLAVGIVRILHGHETVGLLGFDDAFRVAEAFRPPPHGLGAPGLLLVALDEFPVHLGGQFGAARRRADFRQLELPVLRGFGVWIRVDLPLVATHHSGAEED